MSDKSKTRLFFLKSQPNDMKMIETYLSKRDFDVMSASDLREGLLTLIPFEPTYVFIAWDHPNGKVNTIPKVIYQSSTAIVIPYTLSSGKEHTRKLEMSGFTHKLFAPVSGPSIMRIISKIEKEALEQLQDSSKPITGGTVPNDPNFMVNSKKKSLGELEQFLKDLDSDQQSEQEKKALQAELLKRNQEKLKSLQMQNLDEKLKKLLQQKFQDEVREQMHEALQTGKEGRALSLVTDEAGPGFRKLLCLIVQSASWCGYLLVASQTEINNEDYKSLIQAWLQDQLVDLSEISNHDYFDVKLEIANYADLKTWVEEQSDYLEFIEVDKNEIFVSFFTLDPKYLIVEINDQQEMMEVPLELIDVDRVIPFSLFIHLPENKKYLLYTLPHQSLMANQKQRLLDKSVNHLFTPIEFEAEFKQLKAEKYLNSSYQKLKKDIGT